LTEEEAMAAEKVSFKLPTAQEVMEKLALAEAEKASAAARKQAELESEKKMLLEKITKPSGVSDEEALRRVAAIIERAVSNGLTEVQVYRFPNALCTDHGRAINQQEPGWETTLTGLPKEMYEFWERQLRSRGYKLRVQIVDFPGGMPGDVGITLKWA
jgi:molybdopterin-biosynthesis enzyme MoeA-like protein